jgi:hypothetical protein
VSGPAFSLVDESAFEPPPRPISEGLTLERLVEDRELGALPISPAQRALCRAADGLPVEHLDAERIRFHFGYAANDSESRFVISHTFGSRRSVRFTPPKKPRVIIVRTGVRAAKSLIAAFGLIMSALTCTFRRPPEHPDERPGPDGLVGVRPGELVRALIVAPRLRLSRAPFHHLLGALKASKLLGPYVVSATKETVTLRRDDGNEVLVEMVAASGGGANLRSTWLAAILFDEADFHDEEGAAVSFGDNYKAVVTRVLEGGQIWIASSPWDDAGEFHEMFSEAFGKAAANDNAIDFGRALAFHSDSLSMNPTLNRAEIAAERERDPDNAAREYDAVPLASGSLQFFPKAAIDACMEHGRTTNLPANDAPHWGGTDLGLRKNSSALALCRRAGGKVVLAFHEEKIPQKGAPLKPSEVCRDFAGTAVSYRTSVVRGDTYHSDTAFEVFPTVKGPSGRTCAFEEWSPGTQSTAIVFTAFRELLLEGNFECTSDPRLRKQMEDTKFKKTPDGGIKIVLPKHGAAHGDVLMAVALAATQVPAERLEGDFRRPKAIAASSGDRWGNDDGRGFG